MRRGGGWWNAGVVSCVAVGGMGAFGAAQAQESLTTDSASAAILTRVRQAWGSQGQAVEAFGTDVRERWSAYVATPLADRLAFRREVEADLTWSRSGGGVVDVHGARSVLPALGSPPKILEDVETEALDTTFDPTEERRTLGIGSFRLAAHPVLEGNTRHYRFLEGDTTTIRLADGLVVRLIEVSVAPATEDADVVGAMWIDPDTWQIVREVYRRRPASARPGQAKLPLIGEFTFDLTGIGIDYALWDGRWWMPRVVTLAGTMGSARLGQARLEYRRAYGAYEVEARPTREPPTVEAAPAEAWTVVLPENIETLLAPPSLPASILATDDEFFDGNVLEVDEALPAFARVHRFPVPSHLGVEFPRLDLIRYNRVEGQSVGARAVGRSGPYAGSLTVRLGTAARGPDVVGEILREAKDWTIGARGFRTLAVVDGLDGDLMGTLSASLLGRDEGEYYRATGGSVALGRGGAMDRHGAAFQLSLAEESPVTSGSDAGLPSLWGGGSLGRPNLRIQEARQLAMRGRLWIRGGRTGGRASWRADVRGRLERGDFDYGRGEVLVETRIGLGGPVWSAVEAAAGDSWGNVPVQGRFLLGGSSRVAGYDPATVAGPSFWRLRAELGLGREGVSPVAFFHLGRAKEPANSPITGGRIRAAGLGLTLMGGALRLDLTRRMDAPTGWALGLWSSLPAPAPWPFP